MRAWSRLALGLSRIDAVTLLLQYGNRGNVDGLRRAGAAVKSPHESDGSFPNSWEASPGAAELRYPAYGSSGDAGEAGSPRYWYALQTVPFLIT